jgi:transmembrane sensor
MRSTPTPPTRIDPSRLDRYLAGEATPEDQAAIDVWLAANPRGAEIIRSLRDTQASMDADREWLQRLWTTISDTERQSGVVPNATRAKTLRWPEGGAATVRRSAGWMHPSRYLIGTLVAGVAFAVFAGVRGWAPLDSSVSSREHSSRIYTTPAGQQAMVTLVDGSRVRLGPDTRLLVQDGVGGLDVQVTGQALFSVTPRPDRFLRVRAGQAIARVLGTTFLVRRYADDRATRIFVTAGRVAVSGTRGENRVSSVYDVETPHVLGAHALGVVDDSGQVRVTPQANVEELLGWSTGHLVFRDTPASDVVSEIGRTYGVQIRLSDSTLAARKLTWNVPTAQRSLADVLEALSNVLAAHVVRSGSGITLVPGAPPAQKSQGSFVPLAPERQHGR